MGNRIRQPMLLRAEPILVRPLISHSTTLPTGRQDSGLHLPTILRLLWSRLRLPQPLYAAGVAGAPGARHSISPELNIDVVRPDEWGRARHQIAPSTRSSVGKVMSQLELEQLTALGVYPDALAGRLRLVLVIGCYGDFRFTRDILSSGSLRGRSERAVQSLLDLGADCDCSVFEAIGQLPRGIFRHKGSYPGKPYTE